MKPKLQIARSVLTSEQIKANEDAAKRKAKQLYAQPFQGVDGLHYVHIIAGNGEIVAVCEAFDSPGNATRAAKMFAERDIVYRPRGAKS